MADRNAQQITNNVAPLLDVMGTRFQQIWREADSRTYLPNFEDRLLKVCQDVTHLLNQLDQLTPARQSLLDLLKEDLANAQTNFSLGKQELAKSLFHCAAKRVYQLFVEYMDPFPDIPAHYTGANMREEKPYSISTIL